MISSAEEKKLPLLKILDISFDCCLQNLKSIGWFTLINLLFLLVSVQFLGGYSSPLFLIWAIFYYIFWCYFFRFYFHRKPYLMFRKIFDSLVPSTKILVLTFAFAMLLAFLPYIPLFMGLPLDSTDKYTYFLKEYMQESKVVDWGLNFILLFVSPLIFYRPFMAWISALVGRSGLLKTAFAKTAGNYWRFVALGALFNIVFIAFETLGASLALPSWTLMIVYSPLIVYFNVVIAKIYEFFFLDNLEE